MGERTVKQGARPYPMTWVDVYAVAAFCYLGQVRRRGLTPLETGAAIDRWIWCSMRLGELGVMRAAGVPHRAATLEERLDDNGNDIYP